MFALSELLYLIQDIITTIGFIFIIIFAVIIIDVICADMKYLVLNVSQIRQARRPRIVLKETVKQPYDVCCLNGHVFKGVQWLNANDV